MRIGHIAIWTNQLEVLRDFYVAYFHGVSGNKYINQVKGFASYFIYFEGNTALELMTRKDISISVNNDIPGICHIGFHLETKEDVLHLTEKLRADGYVIAGEPRLTGDGFFESIVLDPDGNKVELVYKG